MNDLQALLDTATEAAHAAGELIQSNFGSELTVNEMQRHDIKLELDVRSQKLITDMILAKFPEHAILGEEGGDTGGDGPIEWIVDPIDGTVNYFFGIPHFCVSIAARERDTKKLLIGVIFDPMQKETFSVKAGGTTLLTRCYRPEEKNRAQGLMDTCVFWTMAVTSFSSGALITTQGWTWLNRGSLMPIVAVGVALAWLALQQRRVAAA